MDKPNDISSIAHLLKRVGLKILSLDDGLVECPGKELHTAPNKVTDCRAWSNHDTTGIPVIQCYHTSCAELCMATNRDLRRLAKGRPISPSNKGNGGPFQHKTNAASIAKALRASVQKKFRWTYNDIQSDSRSMQFAVGRSLDTQWAPLIALFPPASVVWIGRDLRDTGSENYKWRFRTSQDWLDHGCPGGVFICPNSFKIGSYRRTKENVDQRHFLVVESDVLSHDETGAVFRFFESAYVGMKLRAVVDTGGTSLHGWFEYPPPEKFALVRELMGTLECDLGMLNPSQPARLPGCIREETKREQRLIYFT